MNKRKKVSKVGSIITTVLLILVIVLLVLMFVARASGHTISVFGFRFYRVSSGSMEPTLMTGDVILVQNVSMDNVHKGDIISYKAEKGEMAGNVITHRVIEEPETKNGICCLRTKGDDAAIPDPEITSDQIIGKYVTTLPLIGKLYSFFLKPAGLITMIIVIVLLFSFEMISLIVSYKSLDKKVDDYTESLLDSLEDQNQEATQLDDLKD